MQPSVSVPPTTPLRWAGRMLAIGAFVLPAAVACVPGEFQRTPVAIGGSSAGSTSSAGGLLAAQASAPEEIHLGVKEWVFTPAQLRLPANKPVTLVLDNRGNVDHDVSIPALGVKLTAAAGKSATQTVTATKEGTFELLCSIPGHKEAGMKGSAIVSPATAGATVSTSSATPAVRAAQPAPAIPAHASHAAVATTATKGNTELQSRMEGDTRVFDITAQHVQWEVLPGEFVDAYAYNGQVPGPVVRVTEGEKIKVNLRNELGEPTVIHFHGPTLPNSMDGVPDVTQKVVDPGQTFTYAFTARPSGTFMYHTHHNSAEQEAKGLYGLFIVEPEVKPIAYDREVVQVLSELSGYYVINGKAFPATGPIEATVGEKVLIRLVNLGQMNHPMHLHGMPFKIVATDGYPVPEAQALTKDVVNIAPGERYDLLVATDNPGTWVFHCHILSHVQNHGVEPGGMITVVKVNPA